MRPCTNEQQKVLCSTWSKGSLQWWTDDTGFSWFTQIIFLFLVCEQKKLKPPLLCVRVYQEIVRELVSMAGGYKDTSILDSSYIEGERKNSCERAGEGRLLLTDGVAHGSVRCLCTYNESIHRTVRLQFLSSDPWWLKFLPFVPVHDTKCHTDEAWSTNWQCR